MALSDIFTGDAQAQAAAQQRQFLAQLGATEAGQIGSSRDIAQNALLSGQGSATGALGTNYGLGTGAINTNLANALASLQGYGGQAANALTGYGNQAFNTLGSGVNNAVGAYGGIGNLGSGFAGISNLSSGMYADAMGLNGQAGIDRAQAAFRASPGYQYQLGQGIDALNRTAAAGGQGTLGGNVLKQGLTYGQGLADQDWQSWLQGLTGAGQGYGSLAANALGTAAQGTGNAYLTGGTAGANLLTGLGTNLGNIYTGLGTGTGNLYSGAGTNLANLYSGLGNQLGGIYTGTGQNLAQNELGLAGLQSNFNNQFMGNYGNTYMNAANAQAAGAGNLFNALGGLAQFGASGGFNPGSYGQLFTTRRV
jgi:hypothetical protein